jgi:galactofuranosylgalactofuranosylrhamnosyl-N-acetylglucosaminyl-diphospho-decaprenol beta-1,5/1,6-galactofuranosyltransferase
MTSQSILEDMTTETRAKSLLQRIILPRPGEPLDVRTLYVEESQTNARRAHATTRTSLSIGAESEVSFCTYFNALPASYWRRWSILSSVVLRLELAGHGRVDVYRSKADGSRIHVQGKEFAVATGADSVVVEFETDLAPFEDGGWIWFDITTDTAVTLLSGGWYAPVEAPGEGSIAVGMPTFNRPTDAVKTLAALGSDPLVLEKIAAVIIPDQGTRKVVDEPGFAESAAALGNRLAIHDQPNLGGSGGYSRVMYEALKTTDAEYIVYMDDDIEIEPDSILRALAFARFAKSPVLVGGQMLNLQERSHLHVMGEVVDRGIFMWTAAPNVEYDHDFSKTGTTRSCCTGASTSTSTAGGPVSSRAASPRNSASRFRCSSSGTTRSTVCAPVRPDTRPSPCPARRCGTWPGATRTTPSTGRRISTCAIAWSSPRCICRATGAAWSSTRSRPP